MIDVYIAIGSNVGDRRDFCSRALGLLGLMPRSRLVSYSSTYETAPVGNVGGPFLNLVAHVETELPAERLLQLLLETERGLGRNVDHREGPRTIDLDLLFYGDQVIRKGEHLIVPHPRLHLRRFVMAPLAELAPDLRHPILGLTMTEIFDRLEDLHVVARLSVPVTPWTKDGARCGPSL